MKNPFEKIFSRRQKYGKTEEAQKRDQEEIDNLEKGHRPIRSDNYLAEKFNEMFSSIASLSDNPRKAILKERMGVAQKKLEEIRAKDENEAYDLNDKYAEYVREAIGTQDDAKLRDFEGKALGMGDDYIGGDKFKEYTGKSKFEIFTEKAREAAEKRVSDLTEDDRKILYEAQWGPGIKSEEKEGELKEFAEMEAARSGYKNVEERAAEVMNDEEKRQSLKDHLRAYKVGIYPNKPGWERDID